MSQRLFASGALTRSRSSSERRTASPSASSPEIEFTAMLATRLHPGNHVSAARRPAAGASRILPAPTVLMTAEGYSAGGFRPAPGRPRQRAGSLVRRMRSNPPSFSCAFRRVHPGVAGADRVSRRGRRGAGERQFCLPAGFRRPGSHRRLVAPARVPPRGRGGAPGGRPDRVPRPERRRQQRRVVRDLLRDRRGRGRGPRVGRGRSVGRGRADPCSSPTSTTCRRGTPPDRSRRPRSRWRCVRPRKRTRTTASPAR